MQKEDTEHLIISEVVEPFAAYLIGKWFDQCMKAKEKAEKNKDDFFIQAEFRSVCETLWFGVKCLNKLAIPCQASHFTIVMNNKYTRVAVLIKSWIGIDPRKEPF